ncbi:MAG: type II toxin-antitoxin system VapC family toxin [Georgenia sp.]
MIVIDASAMVEALVGRDVDPAFLDVLAGELDAPHLLDVDVMSVLRRLTLVGMLDPIEAEEARRNHFAFAITRHEVEPFADRIWDFAPPVHELRRGLPGGATWPWPRRSTHPVHLRHHARRQLP